MTDQNLKLGIDARHAKRGASEYSSSINKMTRSLREFSKQQATLAGNKTNSGQFRAMARDMSMLGKVRISPATANQITRISSSLNSFKVSKANINNFRMMARELSRVKIDSRTATQLGRISKSMRDFKAPNPGQVRNMQAFINALRNIRAPAGMTRVARQIQAIGAAAGVSSGQISNMNRLLGRGSVRQFGANLKSTRSSMNQFNAQTVRLTGSMRGLENAMSASYQMGSQLRVMFGALTVGGFANSVYDSTIAAQRFQTTISVTAKTQEDFNSQMMFAKGISETYGISLRAIYEEYGKFTTAARLSGQSLQSTQYIFEQFSGAMRVMGLDAERQKLTFLALTQIFSKGKVSTEELRRQLGEQVPGIFEMMQQVIREVTGDANANLDEMLRKGMITSDGILHLAKHVEKVFGPRVEEALDRADTAVGRLQNRWVKLQETVGRSGFMDAVRDVAQGFVDTMNTSQFDNFAKQLGEGLGNGVRIAGDALQYLFKNIHTVKEVAKALIALQLARSVSAVGSAAFSAVGGISAMARSLGGVIKGVGAVGALKTVMMGIPTVIGAAVGAAFLFRNEIIKIGNENVRVSTLIQQAWYDVKGMFSRLRDAIKGDMGDGTFGRIAALAMASINQIIAGFWLMGRVAARVGKLIYHELSAPFRAAAAGFRGDLEGAKRALLAITPQGIAHNLKVTTNDIFNDIKEASSTNFLEEWYKNAESAAEGFAKRAKKTEAIIDAQNEKARKHKQYMDGLNKRQQNVGAGFKPIIEFPESSLKNPVQGGDKDNKTAKSNLDSISKAASNAEEALKKYKDSVAKLNTAQQQGLITSRQYADLLEHQKKKLQEAQDPYAAMVRNLKEEINLKSMTGRAGQVEAAYRERVNQLLEQGVVLTDRNKEKLRELLEIQNKLNDSSSFEGYINGLDDLDTALDKVTTQALDGFSDAIADLVVDGKADFRSLAKSILKEFVKIGVNQVYKSLFGGMANKTQQMSPIKISDTGGGLGTVSSMMVQAANVAVNGTSLGMSNVPSNMKNYFSSMDPMKGGNAPQFGSLRGTIDSTPSASLAAINGQLRGTKNVAPASMTSYTGPMADPSQFSKMISLSPQEITDLKKTLATEVIPSLSKGTYDAQSAGIVDTILNRKVSGRWGDSVTSVVNARKQFSDINGPVSWRHGRHSVSDLPDSMLAKGRGLKASNFVDEYLQKRSAGQGSSVGGHLNYANPNYSDKVNMEWINKLDGPRLGAGKAIHYHGTVDSMKPVDSNYGIRLPGQSPTMMADNAGGIDPMTTSSITQANQALQQTSTQMQTLSQNTQQANQNMQTQTQQQQMVMQQEQMSTQQKQIATQTEVMTSQQSAVAHQQNAQAVQQAGMSAQTAAPSFQQAGTSLQQAGMQAQTAGMNAQIATPGLGGFGSGVQSLMGPLSQAVPGLGQFGGAIMSLISSMSGAGGGMGGGAGGLMGMLPMLFGGFREGGMSGSAVGTYKSTAAAFANAPHYSEGTRNTGKNGQDGMPAVLHPNEAVIPLSRGRKIPVETNNRGTGMSGGGSKSTTVQMNISGVSDVDGFKRSEKQIQSRMAAAANRANARG